jgi:hypothetical protein
MFDKFSIGGILVLFFCGIVSVFWKRFLVRSETHADKALDLLAKKSPGPIRRFLEKPVKAAPSLAPAGPEPTPTFADWTVGDLPNLGMRASWTWTTAGPDGRPLCPSCSMRMTMAELPHRLSMLVGRTLMVCPYGHISDERDGTPQEILWNISAEVERMRVTGEWRAAIDHERYRPAAVPATKPARPLDRNEWTSGYLPQIGIRAKWGWDFCKPRDVEPLCPNCFTRMEPMPSSGSSGSEYPRTLLECPRGDFAKGFPDPVERFPERLHAEVERMWDSGEWRDSFKENRARTAEGGTTAVPPHTGVHDGR